MSTIFTTPGATLDPGAMSAPRAEQFDGEGRLISVTFESAPVQAAAAAADRWLVALDGSGHSMHALAMAVRLAAESGTHALDLVNVQHWLSKEAAEIELPRRGWTAATDARALLDARGLGWRLHVWMGEPAARIVELAETLGSRGIVIGARGLTAGEALLLGSVAQQVIHTTHGAVLIVRSPEASKE